MMAATTKTANVFDSTFPVWLPIDKTLVSKEDDFKIFIVTSAKKPILEPSSTIRNLNPTVTDETPDDASTLVSETTEGVDKMRVESAVDNPSSSPHPFIQALQASSIAEPRDMSNAMLTENADVAYESTKQPLVDLFFELEEVVEGSRLQTLLDAAWKDDPLTTLKIIFNARSIHVGKSSRTVAYKCFGWLAQNHPLTLLTNLQWLCRPIIEKKVGEKKEEPQADDMILVDAEKSEDDSTRFDVKNGVAHGYWKDLLNILALRIEGKLDVLANPKDLLNIERKSIAKKDIIWNKDQAKKARNEKRMSRHEAVIKALKEDPFYRALHMTVARLFGTQLQADLVLLGRNDKKSIRQISLCAKWAPSFGLFHDKHTTIVSSIAEFLYPTIEGVDPNNRELYLRHAREAYRKDISSLRKALEIVERDIAAETFGNIKYEQVPSLAMNQYANLFATKDGERFDAYITNVAEGKKSISGATLLPSTLIAAVRAKHSQYNWSAPSKSDKKIKGAKALVDAKVQETNDKVVDGQWNTLVKRIKESGSLENCIAVCDVSGSMCGPILPDKSCPLDSAIGLSLLLAEVTKPPFGGHFITFTDDPSLVQVQGATLQEKVANMEGAEWGGSTNFVSVFEDLILPQAQKFNVKQEDMVKRVFVFSDMQFNSAEATSKRWSTSYERIKKQFELYNYEMPELVFWNLAGGRDGLTAPKPVTADEEGTALVSGYSQGMMKVFLDNGAFEDPEAEVEIVEEVVEGEDGEEQIRITKKQKVDPMSTVRKAISHKSYSMLTVMD